MLTKEQVAALTAAAKQKGVDPAELIKEAESMSVPRPGPQAKSTAPTPSAELKPLYMYHLPFVTVNEVRTIWLGLDPIDGGDENAASYAASQTAPQAKPQP